MNLNFPDSADDADAIAKNHEKPNEVNNLFAATVHLNGASRSIQNPDSSGNSKNNSDSSMNPSGEKDFNHLKNSDSSDENAKSQSSGTLRARTRKEQEIDRLAAQDGWSADSKPDDAPTADTRATAIRETFAEKLDRLLQETLGPKKDTH